jgi:hypothetical protein
MYAVSLDGLQKMFSHVERAAAATGLLLNHGRGKTEFFTSNPGPNQTLTTNTGNYVPVARHYKYLGVNTLDMEADLQSRKCKAWGALKSFSSIWRSTASLDTKRSLFYSLVEPIFTYAIWVWPLTLTVLNRLNSQFSRMLRYALGLPPAFISRETHHTEDIYDKKPFLSTMILGRRFSFLAHFWRDHNEFRNFHPGLEALKWVPPKSYKRRSGGQALTLQKAVMRDAGVETISDLLFLFDDRALCTKELHTIQKYEQQRCRENILKRRQREQRRDQAPPGVQR